MSATGKGGEANGSGNPTPSSVNADLLLPFWFFA